MTGAFQHRPHHSYYCHRASDFTFASENFDPWDLSSVEIYTSEEKHGRRVSNPEKKFTESIYSLNGHIIAGLFVAIM